MCAEKLHSCAVVSTQLDSAASFCCTAKLHDKVARVFPFLGNLQVECPVVLDPREERLSKFASTLATLERVVYIYIFFSCLYKVRLIVENGRRSWFHRELQAIFREQEV